MNEKTIEAMAVISEPVRIRILTLISSAGELRAKDILEEFSFTQPTLSHHMNLLTELDIVTARKEGRCIWYSVNKAKVEEIRKILDDIITGTPSKPAVRRKTSVKPVKAAAPAAKPVAEERVEAPVLKKKDKDKVKDKKDKKKKSDKKKDKKKKK